MTAADPQQARCAAGEHLVTPQGTHRDDVLLTKLLRVRARLGLFSARAKQESNKFPTELRLLDEVIEELTNGV